MQAAVAETGPPQRKNESGEKTTDALYKDRFGPKLTPQALAELDGGQLLKVQKVALELAEQLELMQEELILAPSSGQDSILEVHSPRATSPRTPTGYIRPVSPRPTSPYQGAKKHFYKQLRRDNDTAPTSSSSIKADADRKNLTTPTNAFFRACQQQFLLPEPIVSALVEATHGSRQNCLHLNHYSVGDRYASSLASAMKQCPSGTGGKS
jgi:hypothetical protein